MADLSVALVLKAIDKMTAPLAAVSSKMKAFGQAALKVGENWKEVGEKVTAAGEKVAAFAEKAKALIDSILEPADALEEAMADLGSAFPDAKMAAALDNVRKASLAWSSQHTQSAAEYVAAAKLMLQAGIAEASAVEATNVALRLATATKTEAGAATRTLTVLYNQLADKTKDPVAELNRLSDALTRAKQLFPTLDVAALTDPLKEALPAAKNAGVAFEQLIATLGQLNKAGLQGGEAGAALAKIIQSLAPASKALGFSLVKTADGGLDLVATLKQIEAKFGSIDRMSPETKAKLEQAFGPDVWKALTGLLGQTGDLEQALDKIKNSSNASAIAQQKLEATRAAQAKISQQAIDALKVELAAGLAPALEQLVPITREAIAGITDFVKANPELVQMGGKILLIVAAVASVVGPLMIAGGAVMGFAGFLMTLVPALVAATLGAASFAAALLANPITWIVLALVALAAVIYIYWEPISAFFLDLWETIGAAFRYAAAVATAVWEAASGAVSDVFEEIRLAFSESFIGGVHKALHLFNPAAILTRIFLAVLPILAAVWKDVRGQIYAVADEVHTAVATWWNGVLKSMHAAGAAVRAVLKAAWESVRNDLYEAFDSMGMWLEQTFVVGIKNDFAEVVDFVSSFSLADAGENIVNTLIDGMKRAAEKPAEVMKGITSKIRDYLPFSPAKEGALRDLHRVRLVETVAESMSPKPMVSAIEGVTKEAYATFAAPPGPELAPFPDSVRAMSTGAAAGPSSGAGASGPISIEINIHSAAGESNVDALEAWLANPTNTRKLARAAMRGAALEQRAEFA